VAVRDAVNDTLMIYANTEFQGGTADNSGDISNGEPLRIGESTDETGTAMSGDMNDVRIYNYTLSADEIKELFLSYDIPSSIDDEKSPTPKTYAMMQNYPNPFNSTTNIQFQIPDDGNVKLSVYNSLGQWMVTLVDGNLKSGMHNVTFNAAEFASGIYFCVLEDYSHAESYRIKLLIE
jgi:hypothetical protein